MGKLSIMLRRCRHIKIIFFWTKRNFLTKKILQKKNQWKDFPAIKMRYNKFQCRILQGSTNPMTNLNFRPIMIRNHKGKNILEHTSSIISNDRTGYNMKTITKVFIVIVATTLNKKTSAIKRKTSLNKLILCKMHPLPTLFLLLKSKTIIKVEQGRISLHLLNSWLSAGIFWRASPIISKETACWGKLIWKEAWNLSTCSSMINTNVPKPHFRWVKAFQGA